MLPYVPYKGVAVGVFIEMHFWHNAHWALWNRTENLLKSLEYYKKILAAAKELAVSQGYSGARWSKMCDP